MALLIFPAVPGFGLDCDHPFWTDSWLERLKGCLGEEWRFSGPHDPYRIVKKQKPTEARGRVVFEAADEALGILSQSVGLENTIQFFWFQHDQSSRCVELTVYCFRTAEGAKQWWQHVRDNLENWNPVEGIGEEGLDFPGLFRMEKRMVIADNIVLTSTGHIPEHRVAIECFLYYLDVEPFPSILERIEEGMTKKEVRDFVGAPQQELETALVHYPMRKEATPEGQWIAASEYQEIKLSGDIWHYTHEPSENIRYSLYLVFQDGLLSRYEMDQVFICVARGTLIETGTGPREVSSLKVGQRVWAYDTVSRKKVLTTITGMHESVAGETVLIDSTLRVTKQHPVYTRREWVTAGELAEGDGLLGFGGANCRIRGIRTLRQAIPVYDLTVDSPGNFFAGGFLVHNKRLGP